MNMDSVRAYLESRSSVFFLRAAIVLSVFLVLFVSSITKAEEPPPSPADYHQTIAKRVQLKQAPIGEFFQNKAVIRPFDIESRCEFWTTLHDRFKDAEPKLEHPIKSLLSDKYTPELLFTPPSPDGYSLPQRLEIEDADVATLLNTHDKIKGNIDGDPPELPYEPGTKGIVTTASSALVPALLISLHMLRQTGSTLPVQVFLQNSSDYDTPLCRQVLPLINANCIPLDKIFEASKPEKELVNYQYKIFSILFSSYEDVLFLDVDNLALKNPDVLFESEVFAETGLLMWPDLWKKTYSPAYFDISGRDIPEKINGPSADSGQLLVSKKSHTKALLLAAYYNFYGPNIYYTLLSQGEPGEGDKETLFSSASLFRLPYHLVTTGPRAWNFTDQRSSSSWHGGMLQADPIWDYALPKSSMYNFSWPGQNHPPGNSHMFLHINRPKLDPVSVMGKYGLGWSIRRQPRRLWESIGDVINAIGYDVEPMVWISLKETACELEGVNWRPWGNESFCALFGNVISQMEHKGQLDTSYWGKHRS
ncbi:hypothetical protein KEM56_000579 [Ascosphaera pollenicola]|nr:hypothetical protein KEM56_000579 [Ascosphaera pollenicola]